jgi:ferredoxin-NADP reductase
MSATSQRRWSMATVAEVSDAADSIRRIALRFPDPVSGQIEGSHVDVDVRIGERTEVRSYSVAARGSDSNTVVLGVHLSPTSRGGSSYMHSLKPGSRIRATQPLASFPFNRGRGHVRFLAGGIGVTALMSMAQAVKHRKTVNDNDYRFTYVGRHHKAMAFVDDLQEVHGDSLTVHTSDENGRFDVARYVDQCPPAAVLYVCGPVGMLDAVRSAWSAAGRPPGALRYETFGTAGRYPTAEFVVRVPKQGLAVTVKSSESMLEALEAAGAEMMFDCRRGECGLCQVDICAVEGIVDHRDVFFSSRQQQSNTRLCTCVTRIASADEGAVATVTLDLP